MKTEQDTSTKLAGKPGEAVLRRLADWAARVVVIVGLTVLLGWLLDVRLLKSVLPNVVTMKANTALAFLLAGICLWRLSKARQPAEASEPGEALALVCALGTGLIGSLTLLEYATGADLFLDQMLFREDASAVGTSAPGRMAPTTALNFLLVGVALVFLRVRWGLPVVPYLTAAATLISVLAFLGYLYGVPALYGMAKYTKMAVHTSVMFLVLGLGITAVGAEKGLMAVLTSTTAGGMVARRLLPAALILPAVLGWLRLEGERRDWYGTEYGLALFTLAMMVAFTGLIGWNARLLHRSDRHRHEADEALRQAHFDLERRVEERTLKLTRVVGELRDGIRVLAESTAEIASAASQLASGATETASSVAETTVTVQEVRQTAQMASGKAQLVAEAARRAALTAQAGRKSTQETGEGMKHIGRQMELITESMARLSEQSQAIGQIISTVDDLAAQSNLLAVNASIEAAKAGEHGKGFAIVAQEVKALAEQSKQATSEVRMILEETHKAAAAAGDATERGRQVVAAGTAQAAEAGQAIETLANSIASASEASAQIESSSQQELVGMDQVALAMNSMKDASNHNLESARQLDLAARNLNELGRKLKGLVERYQGLAIDHPSEAQ